MFHGLGNWLSSSNYSNRSSKTEQQIYALNDGFSLAAKREEEKKKENPTPIFSSKCFIFLLKYWESLFKCF